MHPRYVASSLGWFLRKIAIDYVRYGYVCYAIRSIPEDKATPEELRRIDEKLLRTYGITYHRTTRARRKAKGLANVAYVRYKRWFILLATDGTHPQFDRVGSKDIRTYALLFCGYFIGLRNGKVYVEMAPRRMKRLRRWMLRIALYREPRVYAEFGSISHSILFPGVVRQKLKLLRLINKKRKRAGLPRISWTITRGSLSRADTER
jgi:hypothetical protein